MNFKLHRRFHLKLLKGWALLFLVMPLSLSFYGQSIKRQSITVLGNSGSTAGTYVQQSVGQAYATQNLSTSQLQIHQGFIQPLMYQIPEVEKTSVSVQVYPNPATDYITLNYADELRNFIVRIVQPDGKVIFEKQVYDLNEYSISIQNQKPGMYFVQIVNKENKLNYFSKFIVVN